MTPPAAAFLDGWIANKLDIAFHTSSNPYNEISQNCSHNQWILGWQARYNAICGPEIKDLSLDHYDLDFKTGEIKNV